jgi:UDP-N-acetylglucosamine--N-acetylmuramyl-(pentapeptide) pyrophosphoryl-undecaprenol N-acetylglucosamine transferase
MTKKIKILAGGGGHTGSARILSEELKDRADLSFLVPDDDPLSKTHLEPFGPVETITKPRHPTTPMWRFVYRLAKAFYQAPGLISRSLDVVISTGSNFCIPPALTAWMKGIPLVNIESRVKFTKPSMTASILQHFTEITALQWEEQSRILKGTVFGPLLPKRRVEPWNGGYVLVSGGTYGYKDLFEALSDSSLRNVVLQTGSLEKRRYEEEHPEWRVISFTDRFDEFIAGADVVVSPPGGTPIEAVAYGKPIVIVRYPEWTKAANIEDTRIFSEKLNAPLLLDLKPLAIEAAVEEAKKRERHMLKNGTKDLVETILTL